MPIINEYSVTQVDKGENQQTQMHEDENFAVHTVMVNNEPHLLFRDDERNTYCGMPVAGADLEAYQGIVRSDLSGIDPITNFYTAAMERADAVAATIEEENSNGTYTATVTIDGPDETVQGKTGAAKALYFTALHDRGLLHDTAEAFSMDAAAVKAEYGLPIDGSLDAYDWKTLESGMFSAASTGVPAQDFTAYDYEGWQLQPHDDHAHAAQVFVNPADADEALTLTALPDAGEYAYADFLASVGDDADPYTHVAESVDPIRVGVDLATYEGDGIPSDLQLNWASLPVAMIEAGGTDVTAFYETAVNGNETRYVELEDTLVAAHDASFAQFFPEFTDTLYVADNGLSDTSNDLDDTIPTFGEEDAQDMVEIQFADETTPSQ